MFALYRWRTSTFNTHPPRAESQTGTPGLSLYTWIISIVNWAVITFLFYCSSTMKQMKRSEMKKKTAPHSAALTQTCAQQYSEQSVMWITQRGKQVQISIAWMCWHKRLCKHLSWFVVLLSSRWFGIPAAWLRALAHSHTRCAVGRSSFTCRLRARMRLFNRARDPRPRLHACDCENINSNW